MTKKILFLFVLLIGFLQGQAQVVTYKAPMGTILSSDFTVKVRQKGKEWKTLSVYVAQVSNIMASKKISENVSYSYFDFSGEVDVAVTYNKGAVKTKKVRPLTSGIPQLIGNTILFSLSEPKNLSVEVNGDIFHNLHLFANPLESSRPSASDTSVLYFAPGIHEIGTVNLRSNQTVYIAGGALVKGDFKIKNAKNIKISGRGIIYHPKGPIDIAFSKNITIEGIIMANTMHNSVNIGESDSVIVRNIKCFSDQGWGDGIDIFCSSNILIDQVFMRNSDDCIAIYGHRNNFYGNVKNILVQNSTLWADVAHPIMIGTHGDPSSPDTLSNMKFINIDILDHHENQLDYQGCLAINAGDDNLISNVRFENIRIGDIRKGQLVNMRIMYNRTYNTAPGKGIENIYFKDISYVGSHASTSIIAGYDATRLIKNITFENLSINGKIIADDMPDKPKWYKSGDMADIFVGEHTKGIVFIQSKN